MSNAKPTKPAASAGKPAAAAATNPAAAPAPNPAAPPPPNPAQAAFGKYRTRIAARPMEMPWDSAGWPMPPSAMMPGASPRAAPHPLGSLSMRLGSTVRLSVDLLNATLVSAANALGGMASLERRECGCEDGCGHHDRCCGHDCCYQMELECCRPSVRGCGCGC
jgi:hypothetical protein